MMKSNLSLYHLGEEHQKLLAQLYNQETGEIDEKIEAQVSALLPTIENKCIAVAKWIKKLEHERNEIESVKEEISLREQAYNKSMDEWQEYLKKEMIKNRLTKVSCPYFTLQVKTNPYSTDVYDEFQVPSEYMKTREIKRIEIKPDKEAIKKHVLETGEQVPGAKVEQKTKLVISIEDI